MAPRGRILFHLQALSRWSFFWLPVSVAAGVGLSFVMPALWSILGASLFAFSLFLLALWYPTWAFERWGYSLRDDDLVIARGVLVRHIVAIPTSRIQHVDTRQGPIEQWLGLARLQVYTASGMGADGVIPGLDLDDADDLRDRLVRIEGDDGV